MNAVAMTKRKIGSNDKTSKYMMLESFVHELDAKCPTNWSQKLDEDIKKIKNANNDELLAWFAKLPTSNLSKKPKGEDYCSCMKSSPLVKSTQFRSGDEAPQAQLICCLCSKSINTIY